MTAASEHLTSALADRYRIERALGAGGMATVYLAHDVKHDRKVALKVLKPELAAVLGADRFVVEIKTTAALQHPHILPLFDSGEADGFLYYVMPFIDGETLRAKLDRETQLGIDESVRIATQVADALDYAHRHGVIHRDIKPENILLHDGRPMVADFGIALAVSAAAGGRMTETGLSLGTPHYMSPEQATAAKEITARSDVYSLGSVLYEMLTGSPPHTGASAQQIIMKIVTEEAAPVAKLRKAVPPNVAAAVSKSLEKLPADRFASAREFADGLTNAAFTVATSALGTPAARTGPVRTTRIVAFAIGAVLVLVAAWGWFRSTPEPTLHASIPPRAGTSFIPNPGWPALSPDGRTVVFAAMSDGSTRLYRRPVDGFTVEAIEGSDDATYPFFSPDGAWVGFFTRSRQIRKVALTGGPATTLADIPFWRSGAAWRRDGSIVVVSDARGLYSVPDHGGTLSPLAKSDSAIRIDSPQELRDGRLIATRNGGFRFLNGGRLVTMAPGETRWSLVPGNERGVWIEPGFLISRPGSEVVATRFDLASGRSSGNPVAVLNGLGDALTVNARGDVAYFAFPNAPLAFAVLVDRSGSARRVPVAARNFRHPRLSPDGTRLAVNVDGDLWVLDLRTTAWTRVTTNGEITEPQWSPDGRRLAHTVFDSAAGYNPPVVRNADGSGGARVIAGGIGDSWTSDWSSDGRHLAVYGGAVGMNVSVVDLDSVHAFHPVTRIAAIARNARFSPDGHWLAYQSNETGRMQVYVVSYPELDQKRPISTEGGTEPAWRPRGGELYYRNGQSMMVAAIRTAPTLEVGTPRELFRGAFLEDRYGDRSYDVMPDAERFLMFEANPAAAPELRVIRNWAADFKATVPR
jgi:Tol biopolymer transport system component